MGRWREGLRGVASRGLILGLVVAIAAVPLSATASVSPVSPGVTHLTFAADDDPYLTNPERGLNSINSSFQTLPTGAVRYAVDQHFTLIHAYVDLSAYVDVDTLPPELFAGVEEAFRKVRDGGVKVILRFSYSPGGTTQCGGDPSEGTAGSEAPGAGAAVIDGPSDAPLKRILSHIGQLGQLVRDHADLISSIEAGFLGEFGEWHCSTYNSDGPVGVSVPPTRHAMERVLEAELAAFPVDRQIALRRPSFITELAPRNEERASRIGSHQDCFASGPDDGATWEPGRRAEQMQMIGALGRWHVVNGVVCSHRPGNRVSCENVDEMRLMHFSYLAGDFQKEALQVYKDEGCWDGGPAPQIVPSLGYRLELRDAEVPDRLVPGGSAEVRIRMQNVGWAAPFNPRPVFVVLVGEGGDVHPLPVDADPRTWQPTEPGPAEQPITIDATLSVPADLRTDQRYALALWLPDPAEKLRTTAAYSIRAANTGTWDPGLGMNVLVSGVPAVADAEPEQPSGAAPGELAASGADPAPALLVAVALGAAGVYVVLLARSRRIRRSHRG